MPTIVNEKPQFQYNAALEDEVVAPSYENASLGTVAATLVDVIPIGLVTMPGMNGQPDRDVFRVTFVFSLEERNSKQYNFTVRRQLTLSLHKKSTLKPYFEALAGRKVTVEEETGKTKVTVKSMAEELIGKSVLLSLVSSPGGEYTNIASVVPLPKGMTPPTIDAYVRLKDREQ